MVRGLIAIMAALVCSAAHGQFVFPSRQDHQHDPGLYTEDPFIVEYRHRFFAVFKGDVKTFRTAYAEIANMVLTHPNDPRAVVWLGNGQTVDAALKLMTGHEAASVAELSTSRINLNRAVSLRPNDPNIYMMRAASLYIQGQYWPSKDLPAVVWQTLRDDCNRFIQYLGPKRLARVSIHVRGETYGELGIAYKNLGDKVDAITAFQKVSALCPGTAYQKRAEKEILDLGSSSPTVGK